MNRSLFNLARRRAVSIRAGGNLTPRAFETLAQQVLSEHFGAPLTKGEAPDVPKRFDFVSPAGDIVGDAKYFSLVGGQRLPPAKFSIIAEHVWLLEKTGAASPFLVFGHDPEVPNLWLARYGDLRGNVAFYFLTDEGWLSMLVGPRETAMGRW